MVFVRVEEPNMGRQRHWHAALRALVYSYLICFGLFGGGALADPKVRTKAPKPSAVVSSPFAGVNLATGAFAPDKIPGIYGQNYVYPDAATAAPFHAIGMTVVRFPVLWERIQPSPTGALDEAEMQRIDASIRDIGPFEMVIFDVHNFGSYHGKRLDTSVELGHQFADLWRRLALRYASTPRIAFGLMNEPNGMTALAARKLADAAITAIRATGAKNLVLVPGTQWSGAHSWTTGPASNAGAFADFRDSGNHFVFELHDYLDADASGTRAECVSEDIGIERLKGATLWLRSQQRQAILGEFGVARNSLCLKALERMLEFIDHNADVWMGWTYWAGGAWWGDYFLSIQPVNGVEPPQFRTLANHPSAGRRPKSAD